MLSSHLIGLKDSIATRLLVMVFSVYFGVTLTVTVIHMAAEYHHAEDSLMNDLKVFQRTFSSGLGELLWQMDKGQLQMVLEGIVEIPIIIGAQVKDSEGETVGVAGWAYNPQHQAEALGPVPSTSPHFGEKFQRLIEYRFPLKVTHRGETHMIGEAIFYSSPAVVLKKVSYSFLFILGNSIIKTSALWIIFLWFSRRMLSRPLALLTSAAEQLSFDTLGQLQVDVQTSGRNELKILEEAFNAMMHKLLVAKQRLSSLQMVAENLNRFSEISQTLSFVLDDLCSNVSATQGALFYREHEGQFEKCQLYEPKPNFLEKPPTLLGLQSLFPEANQEIAMHNHQLSESPISKFYATAEQPGPEGHWLCLRSLQGPAYVLCLYRTLRREAFDASDLAYLRSMISEIKLLQQNVEAIRANARMENELRTASAVQKALLPHHLPECQELELASFFQSATETGGDWYGFMTQFEDQLFLLVGDVTGHGTPAALVTATASAACRTLEKMYALERSPFSLEKFIQHLNGIVFEVGQPQFWMTFFAAQIDLTSGVIRFINAGHNFPLLIHAGGTHHHLLNANPPLGYYRAYAFRASETQLHTGDLLCLYTDGIIENPNPQGQCWGERRLIRYLKAHRYLEAKELVKQFQHELHGFLKPTELQDDMTFIACRVLAAWPATQEGEVASRETSATEKMPVKLA